jgi:hypothetical protein
MTANATRLAAPPAGIELPMSEIPASCLERCSWVVSERRPGNPVMRLKRASGMCRHQHFREAS